MAANDDSGDKTEKPTARRLLDARKKGDVAKSKDAGATLGLLVWLLIFAFGTGFAGLRFAALFEAGFLAVGSNAGFANSARDLGWAALGVFVLLSTLALVPAAVTGLFAEFMQVGAILSFEKLKPSLDKLNPVEGVKRMFSLDNLFELAKTIAKTILLLFVVWLVVRAALPEILSTLPIAALPTLPGVGRDLAYRTLAQTGTLTTRLLGWILAVFVLVAVLDLAWQKHSHQKKLRMSLRDIRDEVKQDEGDPHIKASRRQLHQEWANQNMVAAARTANVLVVNPTHIAIAIDYDPEDCPVPVVAGKGEGPLAQAMREAAEAAGVPIIRNIDVARGLFERASIEEIIPEDMFDAIAQILIWARRERMGENTGRPGPIPEPAPDDAAGRNNRP